jgi:hypothetical protein
MLRRAAALCALTMPFLSAVGAVAQVPPPVPVPAPQFNPSNPLVIPAAPEVPVSPGYGIGTVAPGTGIGGLPDSSYSIIAPESDEKPPVKQKHKHHSAARHPQ